MVYGLWALALRHIGGAEGDGDYRPSMACMPLPVALALPLPPKHRSYDSISCLSSPPRRVFDVKGEGLILARSLALRVPRKPQEEVALQATQLLHDALF